MSNVLQLEYYARYGIVVIVFSSVSVWGISVYLVSVYLRICIIKQIKTKKHCSLELEGFEVVLKGRDQEIPRLSRHSLWLQNKIIDDRTQTILLILLTGKLGVEALQDYSSKGDANVT